MIRARKLVSDDRGRWAEFVRLSSNGTLFHLPEFFDYHPPGRFDNHHVVLEDDANGSIAAIATGALSEIEGERWFRSHPGASWGGLVMNDSAGLETVEECVEALIGHVRSMGAVGMEMTPPPMVYHRRPSNYLDFALVRRGFTYRKRELTAVIDLGRMGDEIELAFRDSARRGAARAVRMGIEVAEEPDFGAFYPVLETNLQERHGVRPTHTIEELEKLRGLLGGGMIRQFVARGEQGVLAGMIMFRCNPRVTLAFYISHDARYQALRPVNLVYQEVIRWARDSGYRYLDLGTFTLDMQVNHGLCRFKESFSARGHFRETFRGRIDG